MTGTPPAPAPSSALSRVLNLKTILVLSVLVRLIWIWEPYVDACAWRESDVAMIARNLAHNWDILHPQIDWAGWHPGYVGTEFPLIPLLAALLYKVVGIHDWIGRAVSIPFFAMSVVYLHSLARRIYNERIADSAAAIYCFLPLSMLMSRAFMPDMASVGLSIAGLELFARWVDRPTYKRLVLSAAATALAILVKAPAIIVALPMCAIAWQAFGPALFARSALWIFAASCTIPSAIWYAHALRIAKANYPFHMFGEGGFQIMNPIYYAKVAGIAILLGFTPVAFLAMLAGFRVCVQPKYRGVLGAWVGGVLLFFVLAGAGNRHLWYHLPFAPIMACLAAAGLDRWRSNFAAAAFLVCAIAACAAMVYPHEEAQRRTGFALRDVAAPGELVVVADSGDPTSIYYSQRNGWHFPEEHGMHAGDPATSEQAISDLEGLRGEGGKYFALTEDTLWYADYYKEFTQHLNSCYSRVTEPSSQVIYDLRQTRCVAPLQ